MAERDPLVLDALSDDEISKEDAHQASGLGRTTLDRIEGRASRDEQPSTATGEPGP